MDSTKHTKNLNKTKNIKIPVVSENLKTTDYDSININDCFYSMDKNDVLKILKSNEKSGLSSFEVKKRLKTYGSNQLNETKKKNIFFKFFEQFSDFMVIILLIAAGISFFMAVIEGHKTDFIDPVIILCIVIVNAIVGVIQEFKAEKSIEALKNMTASETTVLRDSKRLKIPAWHNPESPVS